MGRMKVWRAWDHEWVAECNEHGELHWGGRWMDAMVVAWGHPQVAVDERGGEVTERELVLYAAWGIEKAQQHAREHATPHRSDGDTRAVEAPQNANQQHTLRPKDERP